MFVGVVVGLLFVLVCLLFIGLASKGATLKVLCPYLRVFGKNCLKCSTTVVVGFPFLFVILSALNTNGLTKKAMDTNIGI